MRNKLGCILLALLFVTFGNPLRSQDRGSFLWRIDRHFGLSSTRKIDTAFYCLEPRGWMLNLNNNFAIMGLSADFSDGLSAESHLEALSQFNYSIGVTAGYRNLILGYSFARPVGRASDMLLFIAGNAWGVEYRRYENEDLQGRVSGTLQALDVAAGDIRVDTRHLRAYHVFSSDKFSMTAANDHRCIQLRSAGSVLFYTDYARRGIDFVNSDLVSRFGGVERLQNEAASLGLGYGYNYTPNRGRLLFHAAAVPMFVVIMNDCLYRTDGIESHRNGRFRMQWLARLTANYRLNDYWGANLSMIYCRSSFDVPEHARADWNDILIRATLCFRF